ncbi:hypothetical protein NQ317_003878, partial [Molorchus minor]
MDELAFRSSQKFENIQVQANVVATKTKDALVLYSQQAKELTLRLWNSTNTEELKVYLRELSNRILNNAKDFRTFVIYYVNPQNIFQSAARVFGTKRDIYFGCAGLIIGVVIGISIGLAVRKKEPILRYMQAIQCNHYLGCESVTVIEDAIAPFQCGEYEVLVNVKAASVQIIDVQICNGYGRTLRRLLQRLYKQSDSDLPVILGRDCTGIITDIGCKVKRLEVGDEVWLAVPFWSQGTLCQSVLVSENHLSKKPKNVGFEGAASIPYAGSLALAALDEAGIDSSTAFDKKVLVHGGCTPVGCVLLQLLKHWKATVVTTCYKKAVPVVQALGASDIIILSESSINNKPFLEPEKSEYTEALRNLLTELEMRGTSYDVIIKTSNNYVRDQDLSKYCKQDGTIISTLPHPLSSDSCGFINKIALSLFIKVKYELQ